MDAQGSLISFTLNGQSVRTHVAPHQSLIEVLQALGLQGPRESCGQGLCGCCTVSVDGKMVSSCLYIAALADGAQVKTVEGLARGEQLSDVQQAFVECGAFQCGFCTSGFVMMATDLLERCAQPSEEQIRDHLSGNLCRCATYPEIFKAVKLVASKRAGGSA